MAASLLGVPTLMFLRRESSVPLQACICLSVHAGCFRIASAPAWGFCVFAVHVGPAPPFVLRQPWRNRVYPYSSSTSLAPLESHYVAKAFRKNCVASLISWYLSLFRLIYFYCFASWNPHWASLFYFCCCSEGWEEAARYADFLCFSVCFQSFIYLFLILVLPFLLPKMILVICYVSWFLS